MATQSQPISTTASATESFEDDAMSRHSHDYARVERALEWLAVHAGEQPALEQAASAVNMSAFHFQRVFTRWAGISPKQFLQVISLAEAKRQLTQGASVFDAAMQAGLSGPGRLHDAFVNVEAVTPGEYKSGLAGVDIGYGYHPSPFGESVIMNTERGICALGFVQQGQRQLAFNDLARRFPNARFHDDSVHTAELATQVFAHCDANHTPSTPLKLLLNGTRFQIQVWRALLEIPPGAFTSYEALAARIGNPRAIRAVGTANGANPISYLVPCHRVIRKTGALGGYHWGLGRKLAILGQEARSRN
jgi:AraC family transcriptional regulator of adaptative response/methylated-DNA-[protein]-cysteine methyltransferase